MFCVCIFWQVFFYNFLKKIGFGGVKKLAFLWLALCSLFLCISWQMIFCKTLFSSLFGGRMVKRVENGTRTRQGGGGWELG